MSALMHPTVGEDDLLSLPCRGDEIVLATPDPAWAETALAALGTCGLKPGPVRRVAHVRDIEAELASGARLWLVDEDWVAPLLAHRRLVPGAPQPDMLVRFAQFATPRLVAVIESGARGCLPPEAGIAEAREAVRAVLGGELWLSRRLFSAVLTHVQASARLREAGEGADDGLTERQREIVQCVGRGMSNKQIGRHLGISPTTVKTHLHNIFERLGVGGRTMLALRANDSRMH
jgi:DNA-binding NarL/FixJ family response regulator